MEQLFLTVLNMSGTGAVVICVVLLLRLALKRAPKKYSYWLWSAAAFRLVCPVSWKSVFSIFSLAPAQPVVTASERLPAAGSIQYIPPDIGMMAQPRVTLPIPQLSEALNEALPAADPLSSVNPMQVWTFLGAWLWLLGLAALLTWGVVSYARLARRLRTAVRLEEGVFQSEAVGSPFLMGYLRPRIYIPYGLEGERLDYVLAHERFHIARRDYLVKLLAFLILALHWFNPLAWLAFYLMGRDMELRCDEAVLGRTAAKPADYSETLLSFAAGGRFPRPGPLAFGETGVKARIRNALRWKQPRFWVAYAATLAVSLGIVACAANPSGTMTDAQLKRDAWGLASGAKDSAGVAIDEQTVVLTRSEDGTLVTVEYPVTAEVYRGTDAEGASRVTIQEIPASQAALTVTYHFDPAEARTPQRAEVELTGPTPWVWCHTARPEGLTGSCSTLTDREEGSFALSEAQLSDLCKALNQVHSASVYPGRGYPMGRWVTLTDGEHWWTLGFGGDCVVLAFDDETAKKWPIDPQNPAPSWEVHDPNLQYFLETLAPEAGDEPPAPALRFPDALRQEIIDDWRTHDNLSSRLIGTAYRYFDEWTEACAWVGTAPENPLEDESGWLEPKNTAGADILLYGETDHAVAYVQGDSEGNPQSIALQAGYAFAYGDVRVVFYATWNSAAGTPFFIGAETVYGQPADRTDETGEQYIARELRYSRDGWVYIVRLVSVSKDAEAIEDCWARLMEMYSGNK